MSNAPATFARGDKVLLPRGRKPFKVTRVNDDGTLNLTRTIAISAARANRRSYRGIGSAPDVDSRYNVDPSTVTKVGA